MRYTITYKPKKGNEFTWGWRDSLSDVFKDLQAIHISDKENTIRVGDTESGRYMSLAEARTVLATQKEEEKKISANERLRALDSGVYDFMLEAITGLQSYGILSEQEADSKRDKFRSIYYRYDPKDLERTFEALESYDAATRGSFDAQGKVQS